MAVARGTLRLRQLAPATYKQRALFASAAEAISGIDIALRRFQGLGIRVAPGSKLILARKTLTGSRMTRTEQPGAKDRRIVAEAWRTAIEFWSIAMAMHPRATLPTVLAEKLTTAVGGNEDPSHHTPSSERARDMQFELWLASWLAMGDRIVESGEPDLRTTVWFNWRGIAAKRVTAPGKIRRRAQEAARQVQAHTGKGFIAVALDNYSRRRGRVVTSPRGGMRFFSAYPEVAETEAWVAEKAPWVLGIMWFGWAAAWRPGQPRPVLSMTQLQRVTILASGAEGERVTDYFAEHREYLERRWIRA